MLSNKTKGYLSYHYFRVGPVSDNYLLSISGFSGITTDPIIASAQFNLNNMRFTTRDSDNDKWNGCNCAAHYGSSEGGVWWYNHCSLMYPNNHYNHAYSAKINGHWHSLPFIEIKIRPVNYNF